MDEPSYFQSALSSFVTDAACGGAIRHLTDIGYTLDQIVERLDYPAPRAKVQRIMMEYLYESRVLLREEPSEELFATQVQFVQEQDAYGRRSMRKISVDRYSQENVTAVPENSSGIMKRGSVLSDTLPSAAQRGEATAKTRTFVWKESVYDPKRDGKLTELLYRKSEKNGVTYSYVSCPFGEFKNDQYSQNISCLNGRQQDYLRGIRWDQPVLYHRLDQRMLEIIGKLYEAGVYSGDCFFAASREKITIPAK